MKPSRVTPHLARRIVTLASRLVPSALRGRWREEADPVVALRAE